MKERLKKIFTKRNTAIFVILAFGLVIPLTYVSAQDASIFSDFSDRAVATITRFVLLLAEGFGRLLSVFSDLLILVAQYNNGGVGIGNETFVVRAWVILRDLANVFFIIVLLGIAIATILRIEAYSAKRLLFKLILMAVLINFSRSIAVALITIVQAVMLFFVNSFAGVSGLLLTNILLLQKYLTISTQLNLLPDTDLGGLLGASVFAVILIIVGLVVVGAMIIMLSMRLIFIWMLVILSPLAFLLHAVPGGEKYASEWWGRFTKELIQGPLLAFFLWLGFFVFSGGLGTDDSSSLFSTFSETTSYSFDTDDQSTGAFVFTAITETKNLFHLILGIGFLIGGLIMTAQVGGSGAGIAKKTVGRLQQAGTGTLRGARNTTLASVRGAGRVSGVTPRAEAYRDRMATGQTFFKGAGQLLTKEGRDTRKLEGQARAQMGKYGGYQSSPRALNELERKYQDQGRTRTASSRFAMMNSGKGSLDELIGVRAGLKEGDDTAFSKLDEMRGLTKESDSVRMQQIFDLEKIAGAERKTFVGSVKKKADGNYSFKSTDEMRQDAKYKTSNRNAQETQQDSEGIKNDIVKLKSAEKSDQDQAKISEIISRILAHNPDAKNTKDNLPAMRALLDSMKELAIDPDIQIALSDQVLLDNQYKKLESNLMMAGGENEPRRASFNSLLHPTMKGSGTAKAMDRINVEAASIHEPTNSLYQATREFRGGRMDAMSGTKGAFDKIFKALLAAADDNPSGIANPAGGSNFTNQQLVADSQRKVNEHYANYEAAKLALSTATKPEDKVLATADLERTVVAIETELRNVSTPEFTVARGEFEANKERVKEFKANVTDNRQTLVNVTATMGITDQDKTRKLDDVFAHIPQSLKALSKSYADTIGLSDVQKKLQADILKKVTDLTLRDKGQISNQILEDLAKQIEDFENSLK